MKPKSTLRPFLAVIGCAIFTTNLHAADGTWKGNSGAWSDATNDPDPLIGVWVDGIVADGTDSTAFFTGANITAAQTITLDDIGRTVGNITFTDATTSSHNLTISGANTLTLDTTSPAIPTINVTQSGRQLTISSSITGNDGLLKSGAGDLSMAGANTFTGGIELSAGRIVIFNDANEQSFLGDASNLLTITGTNAELYCSNGEATLPQGITISDGITGRITGAFGERTIINGVVAGSGTMVVNGYSAGFDAQLRNTANTFSGPIQILSGDSAILGMASLADSANPISLGSAADDSGAFIYLSQAAAPLVLDNRQFELVNNGNAGTNTGRLPGIKNNNTASSSANTVTVNTDLLITGTGNKSFVLGGSNTGNNAFNGLLADKVVDVPDPDPDIVYKLSILKQDGGKWILGNANNSYTGSTNISGRLEVTKLADGGVISCIGASTNDASNLVLNNGGVLSYTGSGDSTDRAFNLIGTANGHTFSFDSSGAGAVSFTNTASPASYGDANETRTVKLTGTNTGANTFAATLTNNGTGLVSLTKEGDGKWIVTGDNSHTGATTITAGTLLVNGDQSLATGAVNVNGGILGGTGNLGGNVTVAAAGSVAPGTSVGTLSIAGNLTISAMAGGEGTLNYELGSIAASDKIAVTGTLAIGTDVLNFADFAFTGVGGLENGTYKLITSGAAISGTLDPVPANLTGPVGVGTGTLQITGNDLELVVSGIGPDVTPPTLTSIVDNQSGGPIAVNTLVTYTVTFNEDMDDTSVSAADFGNAGTSAVTIGSVSETSPGVFTVQATPTTTGTLKLQINAAAVLEDTSGNDLDTTSALTDDTVITVNVSDPYAAWSGGAAFNDDANGDGVKNGLAWLLGAADKDVSALDKLPAVTQSGGNLVLTFNCLKVAGRGGAVLNVQHSSDLGISDAWASAEVPDADSTVNNVVFDTTDDGDFIDVIATVSVSEAASGKLFGRLNAESAP